MVTENEEVVFTCIVRGYPAPTITWENSGMMVMHDNPRFEINLTTSQVGFTKMVTSYLKIALVSSSMIGEVKCVADPPPPVDVGGRVLNSVSTSTQLSVLGESVRFAKRGVFPQTCFTHSGLKLPKNRH